MKKTEKKSRTTEYEVTVEVRCDLCGKLAPIPSEAWQEDCFDVSETKVSMRTGRQYPDNGSGDTVEFDICPDCFSNRLVPWFKENGANPTEKEWDW